MSLLRNAMQTLLNSDRKLQEVMLRKCVDTFRSSMVISGNSAPKLVVDHRPYSRDYYLELQVGAEWLLDHIKANCRGAKLVVDDDGTISFLKEVTDGQ